MNKVAVLLVALFAMMSSSAQADSAHQAAPARSAPVYFDPATFDPRACLPTPPASESDATTKEIEVVLQAQADRTQAQVDRIQQEDHYNIFDLQNGMSSWFTPEIVGRLPTTNKLLARVIATGAPIIDAAKGEWNRPRPFLVNSRIVTALPRPADGSYPSIHAARAMLDALVLAEIDLGSAQSVTARARQIGDDRVIAGVNYPSDALAGRKLAQAIFNRIGGQREFWDDLKAAQAEVIAEQRKLAAVRSQ